MKFIDKLLRDEVMAEEINSYVEEWHTQDRPGEIWDYLGMTYEEYDLWIEFPHKLADIIKVRNER